MKQTPSFLKGGDIFDESSVLVYVVAIFHLENGHVIKYENYSEFMKNHRNRMGHVICYVLSKPVFTLRNFFNQLFGRWLWLLKMP